MINYSGVIAAVFFHRIKICFNYIGQIGINYIHIIRMIMTIITGNFNGDGIRGNMPTFTREQDGSLSIATQQAITKELYTLLDDYSTQEPLKHREHLGVSVIGDKCSRKLWYGFRWCKLEQHIPRMRRLFKRGHSEEAKFADLLGWMGFHVRTIDPNTKRQYAFSSCGGHYGGSGDSVALLPWFQNDESFRILVEYKTHNKKSFTELKAKGLKLAKPQHYIQMCGYGSAFKTRYGLYCAINKDDDDIYFEFFELDWNVAILSEKKAADIITSQIPPPRISDNPDFFECKYCAKAGICWRNEPVEVNCRSCKNAVPIDKGQWRCNLWNATIPDTAAILKGCPQYDAINN